MLKTYWPVIASVVLTPAVVLAQVAGNEAPAGPSWLTSADAYVKVFGAVLTGLGTLFGLPLVILNFRKTRAEIRHFEAQTASLEARGSIVRGPQDRTLITVADSNDVNIQVLADPRFLGPLLLLLDFILAWIVLTLADHFLAIVGFDFPRTIALTVLAALLLVPIAREARRVRAILRPHAAKTSEGT